MKNKKPLVSVIVPVYNRDKFIGSCLDMLLKQKYKNLEIIVVDDGSIDKSLLIAKEYPVKIIEHKINKGLSAARNTGMDHATGEYIHFMDDDDQINPEFYENLLNASIRNGADMSLCGFINQKLMSKSQFISKEKITVTTNDKYTLTYVGKYGYVWRYLFRADFLRRHKLRFEVGRFVEDLQFSFRAVYYANKIVSVPNAEYIYAYTPNSILNTVDSKKQKKIDEDHKHADQIISNFVKSNGNFKIPGINTGKFTYFLKKLGNGFRLAIKYRKLKFLKF